MAKQIFSAQRLVLLCLAGGLLSGCDAPTIAPDVVELNAAGATFPAPLYERWFSLLAEQSPDRLVRYEAVGSGAGIQQFIDELVDFGATDESLTEEEIAQVDRGVRQLPMTSGANVLAYNLLDGQGQPIKDLRLSRAAYSGIFLGDIVRWNDEEIARHNPGLDLPDAPIQVEYRLDSSGTTSAFTRHLSQISEKWRNGPGSGKRIDWPVGAGMPRDLGIVRALRQVPGSIGYLSFTVASEEGLTTATLENKAGAFIRPTLESMQAALNEASDAGADLEMLVTDPGAADAYPMVTYSWILCYRVYEDPKDLAAIKAVLRYGLQEGQEISGELGYIPLPASVANLALTLLDEITLPQSADTATEIHLEDEAPASALLMLDMNENEDSQQDESVDVSSRPVDAEEDDTSVREAAELDEIADEVDHQQVEIQPSEESPVVTTPPLDNEANHGPEQTEPAVQANGQRESEPVDASVADSAANDSRLGPGPNETEQRTEIGQSEEPESGASSPADDQLTDEQPAEDPVPGDSTDDGTDGRSEAGEAETPVGEPTESEVDEIETDPGEPEQPPTENDPVGDSAVNLGRQPSEWLVIPSNR